MKRPVALAIVGLVLVVSAHVLRLTTATGAYPYWLESTVGPTVFLLLGTAILIRRPNVIGGVFLGAGLTSAGQFLTGQYTVSGMELDWSAVELTGVVSRSLQMTTVFAFLFLLLLFPTGRVVSPRWRPWLFLAIAAAPVLLVTTAMSASTQAEDFDGLDNPLSVPALDPVLDVVETLAGGAVAVLFPVALVGIFLRTRRASGIERLQMKTFLYGAVFGLFLIVFGSVFMPPAVDDQSGSVIWTVGPLCLPASAGLAILRYRLYDIDVIVNKTLVYAGLSVVLAGLYVGLVFGFQSLLAPFTAESDIAIAGSTLAVAAAFRPLRSRVQSFIDHRFYRRKFDAQRTLEEFSDHLRDEVDLTALSARLETVVQETMQPAHVSLWLRTEPS